jgi:hypothetical protein
MEQYSFWSITSAQSLMKNAYIAEHAGLALEFSLVFLEVRTGLVCAELWVGFALHQSASSFGCVGKEGRII